MGKDIAKNLVGRLIFKQIINLLPKNKFDALALEKGSDKYYNTFTSWYQLVTMLFGILSRCDSMGETCAAMVRLQGKLNCKLYTKHNLTLTFSPLQLLAK